MTLLKIGKSKLAEQVIAVIVTLLSACTISLQPQKSLNKHNNNSE